PITPSREWKYMPLGLLLTGQGLPESSRLMTTNNSGLHCVATKRCVSAENALQFFDELRLVVLPRIKPCRSRLRRKTRAPSSKYFFVMSSTDQPIASVAAMMAPVEVPLIKSK